MMTVWLVVGVLSCSGFISNLMQDTSLELRMHSWTKVQYLGGAIGVKGTSENWHNTLSISSNLIQLTLKNGTKINLNPKAISFLSYGGKKMVREGIIVNSPLAVAPIFLLGFKAESHYIGIEFSLSNGQRSGMLLRAHKSNHKEIYEALRAVTKLVELPDQKKN